MADAFTGTIQTFAFNFAPKGWAQCNGQIMQISQNQALFSLISCTFGGDCRTTFGLPDLRGRVAMNYGQGPGLPTYTWGEKGGATEVGLTVQNMPSHNHEFRVTSQQADATSPTSAKMIGRAAADIYADPGASTDIGPLNNATPTETINYTGGGAAHTNMQPFLCVESCIALYGIYPSRN